MKRLQIQQLRQAGVTIEKTAQSCEVSQRSVDRVSAEPPVEEPAAHDARAAERMGRPSKMAPYLERIREWFAAEPQLTGIAIWQRLRDAECPAGKSAVYEAVKSCRPPKPAEGVVRFEGLAGEFSQHDFGQTRVRYTDGTEELVRFFASRLKFSRRMRLKTLPDEKVESVCQGLADAFQYFGGVPLVSVFDNPKTIVTRREGKKVIWHETFSWFITECGTTAHATWPRRPQEKGSVENLVGFGKTSFFGAYRFTDRQDLECKLVEWHTWANEERTCRATGQTPAARFMLEEPRLAPLGLDPKGFRLRYTRLVRTDGCCEFESIRFFVDYEHVGQSATLFVSQDEVTVHVGRGAGVIHPRRPINGRFSVRPEQRKQLLTKRGARPFLQREMLRLCPAAEWVLTELRHRRPDLWEDDVKQLYALLEEFDEAPLAAAFVEAAQRRLVGPEYIEAILRGQVANEVRS